MAHHDQFLISDLTSAFGAKRKVAARQSPAASVENDPQPTWSGGSTMCILAHPALLVW